MESVFVVILAFIVVKNNTQSGTESALEVNSREQNFELALFKMRLRCIDSGKEDECRETVETNDACVDFTPILMEFLQWMVFLGIVSR
jgi:hypothetical protein